MSRVQEILRILDTFIAAKDRINVNEHVGAAFDEICQQQFGVATGFEFIADFAALLTQLEEDIARVPNLTDKQRGLYLKQLQPLRVLFSSKTFLHQWQQFFARIGDGAIRNSLLLMDPLLDPSRYNLRKAVDRESIRAEMADLEKTIEVSGLSDELKRLLQFEVNKMRLILDNEKSFKETKIWEQYEKLTAQLVAAVVGLEEKDRKGFMRPLQKLAGRVREGIGLTADVAGLLDFASKFPLIG